MSEKALLTLSSAALWLKAPLNVARLIGPALKVPERVRQPLLLHTGGIALVGLPHGIKEGAKALLALFAPV